jgi:hypothetical protein
MTTVFSRFAIGFLLGLFCISSLAGSANAQASQSGTGAPVRKYDTHDFSLSETADTIPDLLSKASGDITISNSEEVGMQSILPDVPGQPPFKVLSMTCHADLVVVATAARSESHMTTRKTFVYTDWKFIVQQVLKQNPSALVTAGGVITVARPGGTISIDGRKVRAQVLNFPDFDGGKQYLLYLKFIPKTKSYRADARNTVVLSGGPVDGVEFQNPSKLIADTRAAISLEAGKSEGDWNTSFCSSGENQQ